MAALNGLPEAQRVAIILVDMEDLPIAEVAAILGVAEGTIKSRCSRGRTALAAMLRPGNNPGTGPGQPMVGRRPSEPPGNRPGGNLDGSSRVAPPQARSGPDPAGRTSKGGEW
jgi:RNA polymerase sigma-70 factor (ECF subfamily)